MRLEYRPGRGAGAFADGVEIFEELLPVGLNRGEVRHRADDVVEDGLAVAEDAAFGAAHAVLGDARLFVEDADAATIGRRGIGVARIPVFVPLAVVINEAMPVEGCGLLAREELAPALAARRDVDVDRLARWREQVRVLCAHAVPIDDQHRVPSRKLPHAATRFGMHAEEVIAVQVEEIVVAAAPRRVAGVLQRLVIDTRRRPAILGDHLEKTIAPVWILERIDHHHDVLEELRHLRIIHGNEMVKHGKRCVRAFRLVAVNRVTQPGDGRQRLMSFFASSSENLRGSASFAMPFWMSSRRARFFGAVTTR